MGFTKHFCVVVLPILLAVAIPFVAVTTFRNYSCDIDIFATWADCVWNGRAVNGVCERFRINYPSVGIFFSAGVMQLLSWVGFEGPFQVRAQPFRLVAAAVDSINILLFVTMLRALRVRFAELWTLLFAVLPSSRVGGAMFGQIDGVSQLFLSLGFLSAHQAWSVLDMKERLGRVHVWLLVLSTSILYKAVGCIHGSRSGHSLSSSLPQNRQSGVPHMASSPWSLNRCSCIVYIRSAVSRAERFWRLCHVLLSPRGKWSWRRDQ